MATPASAPRPGAVSPTRVAAGSAAELTITGDDFFADVLTDFRYGRGSEIDARFSVELLPESGAAVALEAVTLVDSRTLTAQVPASTARGLYDVRVVDPSGRGGTLTGALRLVTSAESVAAFTFDVIDAQRAGIPFSAGITAVDETGRTVEGFDGTVSVSVPNETPVVIGPFVLGRGRGLVTVATPMASVQLGCSDALGHLGTSEAFEVTAGEPARVVFTAGPERVAAGACGGPFTLEVQDTFGNAAAVGAATPFTVAVNPLEGGETFSDAACAVPSAAGMLQGTGSFFVRAVKAGRPRLRVVPAAYPSAARELDVDAGVAAMVRVVSAPQVLMAGMCSQPVVVQAQDAFGNAALVDAAVALTAEVAPAAGVTLHSDAACAGALNVLELPAGGFEARFHFRSGVPAMLALSVDAGVLGVAVQGEEVTP